MAGQNQVGPTPGYNNGPMPGGEDNDNLVGQGEMPFDDGKENEAAAEPVVPVAPPMQEMEKISGYDEILAPNVTFIPPPPPSYQEATSGASVDQVGSNAKLTETEARELLLAVAKSKCCWGKGAAESMIFRSLQQSTAVHYALKTFLETRSTDWASEPFRGQLVDGPQNGVPPAPWDIRVETPPMFHEGIIRSEVPHTASVRICHLCRGQMFLICMRCRGWGKTRCVSCHGSGEKGHGENRKRCFMCHGSGKRRCLHCQGRGRNPCHVCGAAGQVKCFVQLTVGFKTNVRDFILERTALPEYLIRNVTGTTLFEDTQPLLNPIQTFPEPQVNAQSASIIQEHRGLAQTGRIWMQNHVIRGVPVFQCDCQWKDKEFQFFVYGDNKKVHIENYPQTCCCGCQLL